MKKLSDGTVVTVDILRGLAAIFVSLGHVYDISNTSPSSSGVNYFFSALRQAFGPQWVIAFFVLSGFCIELSCQRVSRRDFNLKRYAGDRASRLFPMYYIGVFFAIACEFVFDSNTYRPSMWAEDTSLAFILYQMFFLQGPFGTYASLAATNTISAEVFYYIFWGGARNVKSISMSSVLSIFCGLMIGLAPVFYLMYLFFDRNFVAFWISITCFEGLFWALGAACAIYFTELVKSEGVMRVASLWWIPLLFVLTCSVFGSFWPHYLVGYGIFSVGVAMLLIRSAEWKISSNVISRSFGILSYPLYIMHGPLAILFSYMLAREGIVLPVLWHCFVVFAATFCTSYFAAVWIEGPLLALRHKWRRNRYPVLGREVA